MNQIHGISVIVLASPDLSHLSDTGHISYTTYHKQVTSALLQVGHIPIDTANNTPKQTCPSILATLHPRYPQSSQNLPPWRSGNASHLYHLDRINCLSWREMRRSLVQFWVAARDFLFFYDFNKLL